jgi:hypothetical protein
MRIAALTLVMLVAMETDTSALIWLIAGLPLLLVGTFVALLVPWRAREAPPRPQPTRLTGPGVGRHQGVGESKPRRGGGHRPGRKGRHAVGVAPWPLERIGRVGEETTEIHVHQPWEDGLRLRCRTCKLDLPRPAGQPEIGRYGFQSWAA